MEQHPGILVAEDDFEDRYMMTATFTELGYGDSLKLVNDGVQLIEYLDEAPAGAIKLVILDLNMPKMNGTETLRAIKENPKHKHIPIIFFSTSINDIEKKHCFALGALDYITKPARYADYIEACKMFYKLAGGTLQPAI